MLLQRELEKQRQLEHSQHQITIATQHYTSTLLVKFGLLPWRRLVSMMHENMSRATLHHNSVLLRMSFHPWLEYSKQAREERDKAAEFLYNKILLRRTWKQWRKASYVFVSADFLFDHILKEKNCIVYQFLQPQHITLCDWLKSVVPISANRGQQQNQLRFVPKSLFPRFFAATMRSRRLWLVYLTVCVCSDRSKYRPAMPRVRL